MRTLNEIQDDVDAAIRSADGERMLTLAEEFALHNDDEGRVRSKNVQAIVAKNRGDLATAIVLFHEVLSWHIQHENIASQITSLNGLGICHFMIGDLVSAEKSYRRAIELVSSSSDITLSQYLGILYGNLGNVASQRGDAIEALRLYHRSLEYHQDRRDLYQEALILGNIAGVHYAQGSFVDARSYADRSLDLCKQINDRVGIAENFQTIALIERILGHYSESLDYLHRSLDLYQELELATSVALARNNIGLVLHHLQDHNGALTMYAAALDAAKQASNAPLCSMILSGRAAALLALDRLEEARKTLDDIEITDSTDRGVVMVVLGVKAAIHKHYGRFDEAISLLNDALNIGNLHGLRDQLIDCHTELRSIAQDRGDFASYIEHNESIASLREQLHGKAITEQLIAMQAERELDTERREREKERAILFSALPRPIAERMINGERVTGDQYDDAAVIFLDIVGFTTISDQISPNEVVRFLEQVFSSLDETCTAHGVTKIKTIGDSYMAVLFPDGQPRHTQRAALAAVDMIHVVSCTDSPVSSPIQIRIGLHCGPVTAGVIGLDRLQYDVWGDTVNIASRLESTGDAGRIHVSENVAHMLLSDSREPSQFTLTDRGPIEIKGKGLMRTYWLDS